MHSTPPQKVAFLGMGLMGQRMARRLIDAQFDVAIWNRTARTCDDLIQYGAKALALTDIAQYPVILMCLADDHAVSAVFEQIECYLIPEQIIVDFSSLSVDQTVALAQRAQHKHAHWVDSPVSGGTMGAEQGSLVIFAGGNAKIIQRLQPIYDVLSQRVTHMGENGTGQATKICNQLIVAANSTLIAEAVALARTAGVDTTQLAPALADGFADSKPLQILSPRMAQHIFEPVQWKVQTLSKDLNNAMTLAKKSGLQLPVAHLALQQLQQHQHTGFAEADLATFIQHVEH